MKVSFASVVSFAFVFALFLGSSCAQEIVAATYTDGKCTTVMTNPQTLQSGECVFSSDFDFWYTVKAGTNNTANYFYGCKQGCVESLCTLNGSAPFGSCPSISLGNGGVQTFHVSAFRVETDDKIDVQVFSNDQCSGTQVYSTLVMDSGKCQYQDSIHLHLMVSHINPNDAPPERQLAYRAGCNADCTSCLYYGRTELNQCTQFSNVYIKAQLDTSVGGNSDLTLKVWELAVIIAGTAAGSVLFGLCVASCLCSIWHSRRRHHHHHEYAAINHH